MELRCDAKLHGIIREEGILEVKCRSTFCGYRPGIVVLHRFNLHSGEVTTMRYKDPGAMVAEQVKLARKARRRASGTSSEHTSLRIAGRENRSSGSG